MCENRSFVCTECREQCKAIVIDSGIGAYEFWGAVGFDSRPEVLSNCCEALVIDKETLKRVILSDLESDEPDYYWEDKL